MKYVVGASMPIKSEWKPYMLYVMRMGSPTSFQEAESFPDSLYVLDVTTPTLFWNSCEKVWVQAHPWSIVGDGGGFIVTRILGESSIIPRLCFFFFKVEISSCTLIPLSMPGSVHTGSVHWDDCGQMFPDKLCLNCFQIGSHTMPGQQYCQPTPDFVGSRVHA